MIMISIKEALTFDDVTLKPKYSNVLPTEVNTGTTLSKNLFLKIPLYHQQWIQLQRQKWL